MSNIGGFWSYSREAGEASADFIGAIKSHLNEGLDAHGTFEMYIDSDPEHGNRPGADWGDSLVRSLLKSVVFFWVQSPRWVNRAVCRLEYSVFEAHLEAIRSEFSTEAHPLDIAALRQQLIVPIRWSEIHEHDWNAIDPAVRQDFEQRISMTQYDPGLNLAEIFRGAAPKAWEMFKGPSDRIKDSLLNAVPSLGGSIAPLLQFAASHGGKEDLFRFWRAELDRVRERGLRGSEQTVRGARSLARAQASAASAIRCGTRQDLPNPVEQTFILIPGAAAPFWLAAEPVSPTIVARLGLDLRAPLDASGHHVWDRDAATAIGARLRGLALSLPTRIEASAILGLLDHSREERRGIGLRSTPRSFWIVDDGEIVGCDGLGETCPILLTRRANRE